MNLNDIMILDTIKSEKVIKSYYLLEFTVLKHEEIIDNVCNVYIYYYDYLMS